MKSEVQDKPKYCIQSNDGRYVSQQGFTPVLTAAPALAYTWSTAEEAKARIDAYWNALKHTGILALAVQPYHRASCQF